MSDTINQAVQTSKKAVTSFVLGMFSLLFWMLTGLPAIVLGIWALIDIGKSQGRLAGKGFAIAGIVLPFATTLFVLPILVALLLPAVHAAREAAQRQQSMNNMKMIGLAMSGFEMAHGGHLPPAGASPAGQRPNLSWRVHILPYLDHRALYDHFHLDEPWDSDHNKSLIAHMPDVFKTPGRELEPGMTMYLVPTGNGALFQGEPDGPSMGEIRDGTSNTAMLLEVDPDSAKFWTQPDDWEFDPADPARGLGGHRPGGSCLIMMADMSVATVRVKELAPGALSAMITRAGGEVTRLE